MSKIFSPLNLLTLVVIIGVAYLGYNQIFSPDEQILKKDDKKEAEVKEKDTSSETSEIQKNEESLKKEDQTPTPDIIQERNKSLEKRRIQKDQPKEEQQQNKPGFYENQTYYYQVNYPSDWPLKISTKEKVSFGHIFPKNGIGAVKVEIGEDAQEKIQKAKDKAQGRSGIRIEEQNTTVDGIQATKYIFHNSLAGDKDFNILVENYGHDYIIKYSAESPEFVNQAERVVDSFEFIK